MRKVYEYSHLGGAEILLVRHPDINQAIDDAISEVTVGKNKISAEVTMRGRMLYSPRELNTGFKQAFQRQGFAEMKDRFEIAVPGRPVIRNAFKQVDFSREGVLVEVQFGKYAFMFYDLAKFQYFFNESRAHVGVEIVPCIELQREMSTGVSYGEQLIWDIERLRRHFPAVPVKVILVDVEVPEDVATQRAQQVEAQPEPERIEDQEEPL